jgi:hypothetical protein
VLQTDTVCWAAPTSVLVSSTTYEGEVCSCPASLLPAPHIRKQPPDMSADHALVSHTTLHVCMFAGSAGFGAHAHAALVALGSWLPSGGSFRIWLLAQHHRGASSRMWQLELITDIYCGDCQLCRLPTTSTAHGAVAGGGRHWQQRATPHRSGCARCRRYRRGTPYVG